MGDKGKMIKKSFFLYGVLFLLIIVMGCSLPGVKVEVVSKRTALENQVLGTYNSLDQEMLMVASVRAIDSTGRINEPPPKSQDHKDAVLAMQTLAFHEDDLIAFKTLGWVGENNQGLITPFSMDKTNVPVDLREFAERYEEDEFQYVVEQVNNARMIVIKRVIELNENFTKDDLPKVQQIFGKLNAEDALEGQKIQTEDGTWTVKK
jgi:uncharacterized protein YdbL (DUF1318 family)